MQRSSSAKDLLRLQVGSAEIAAAQVAHLLDRAAHPNIEVRVLPFVAGPYPQRESFSMLEFDDPEDPALTYVEASTSGTRSIDRPREREEYEYVYGHIRSKSISIEEWAATYG